MVQDITAAEIRAFRDQMELTQQEFADLTLSKRRTVEDWEAGRRQAPAMLRSAMAAVRKGLEPWVHEEPVNPRDMTFADAMATARRRLEDASVEWIEHQEMTLTQALGDRKSPAEAVLLSELMVAKDGYSDLDLCLNWAMRPRSGWRISFAYRPTLETGAVPTFAFEVRYDNMASYLAVFVDASWASRQPERLQAETALGALGYRLMSYRASTVLGETNACVEAITSALFEMNEGHLITLGHLKPPVPAAGRDQ